MSRGAAPRRGFFGAPRIVRSRQNSLQLSTHADMCRAQVPTACREDCSSCAPAASAGTCSSILSSGQCASGPGSHPCDEFVRTGTDRNGAADDPSLRCEGGTRLRRRQRRRYAGRQGARLETFCSSAQARRAKGASAKCHRLVRRNALRIHSPVARYSVECETAFELESPVASTALAATSCVPQR